MSIGLDPPSDAPFGGTGGGSGLGGNVETSTFWAVAVGFELPERGDEAKVARSLRRSANAEYAQTPLAAVPIPIWREALAVELPALPQVSDAELAASLAALLSRWQPATG